MAQPAQIRDQLERILTSQGFAKSERLGDLLTYTVDRPWPDAAAN